MRARTKQTRTTEQPQFAMPTVSLTPEETTARQPLSQDASDFLGRAIRSSAVIRALIRQVVTQGPPAADALVIEVERELTAGVRWG
jgi:hypothetical protein